MRYHTTKDPQTLLASAARTATTSMTFNTPCIGCVIVIDVTAVTGTPSLTFTLAGTDPASGQDYTILASAAISTVSTTVLRVHPSLTAVANTIAKDVLPQGLKLTVTHGTADSCTYSVGFVGVN